jgi:hypothetical protein
MVRKILMALMVAAAVCAGALALTMGAVGVYSLRRMGAAEGLLYRVGVEALGAATGAEAEYALVPAHVRDMIAETDAGRAGALLADLGRARESTMAHLAALGPLVGGDAEREKALGEVTESINRHWAMLDEASGLIAAGRRAEALAYVRGTADPRFRATRDLMAGLRESMRGDADSRSRANRAAMGGAGAKMAVSAIVVALLSALSAVCGVAASKRG